MKRSKPYTTNKTKKQMMVILKKQRKLYPAALENLRDYMYEDKVRKEARYLEMRFRNRIDKTSPLKKYNQQDIYD